MKIAQYILTLLFVTSTLQTWAQPATTPMADLMRSNGRIYVVIAVLLTILSGLIIYLIRLDRRISRLEKEN
jgi:hypothetical protein